MLTAIAADVVYIVVSQFWPLMFNRIIASLVIAQLTLIGLFGLKQSSVCALLMVPLLVLTLLYCYNMNLYQSPLAVTLTIEDAVECDRVRSRLIEKQLLLREQEQGKQHELLSLDDTIVSPYAAEQLLRITVPAADANIIEEIPAELSSLHHAIAINDDTKIAATATAAEGCNTLGNANDVAHQYSYDINQNMQQLQYSLYDRQQVSQANSQPSQHHE